ncbi:MAG: MATE family efflux transporter [Clostridia bacterium]|nr:MATE family efflux transporter [Clostridia bacterium]
MARSLSSLFEVQDMTSGTPMSGLIRFSLPLLIGNFAQQLYNTVDSMIVGKYIGDTALAAVGTSGPILNLMIVLFLGIATGAGILSAQFFGAKEKDRLSQLCGSAIIMTFLSGLIMSFIGYFTASFMISLMAPPEQVGIGAVTYLQIIFLGMIGSAAYNIFSGILRGMGDSVHPLIYLVIASLLNIVLDLFFVRNLALGIAGVAWATIIAQAVSGALCLIRMFRMKDVVVIDAHSFVPDMRLVGKLVSLGLPAGITSAIFSLSSIIVQNLTNSMGEMMIAANVAVMKVDGFVMLPNFTFGTAITTYVGQNIGAGKTERIRPGTRDMMKLALICAGALVTSILLFGRGLISMFTDTESVIMLGARGLRWLAFGYLTFAVSQVLQGVMRGAGETVIPMWISVFTTVILRMPLAYVLAAMTRSDLWPTGHPDAIFSSLLISWTVTMMLSIFFYRKGNWKKHLPESMREAI